MVFGRRVHTQNSIGFKKATPIRGDLAITYYIWYFVPTSLPLCIGFWVVIHLSVEVLSLTEDWSLLTIQYFNNVWFNEMYRLNLYLFNIVFISKLKSKVSSDKIHIFALSVPNSWYFYNFSSSDDQLMNLDLKIIKYYNMPTPIFCN